MKFGAVDRLAPEFQLFEGADVSLPACEGLMFPALLLAEGPAEVVSDFCAWSCEILFCLSVTNVGTYELLRFWVYVCAHRQHTREAAELTYPVSCPARTAVPLNALLECEEPFGCGGAQKHSFVETTTSRAFMTEDWSDIPFSMGMMPPISMILLRILVS